VGRKPIRGYTKDADGLPNNASAKKISQETARHVEGWKGDTSRTGKRQEDGGGMRGGRKSSI